MPSRRPRYAGLVFTSSPIQTAIIEQGVVGDGTANWPTVDQDEWLRRLGTLPLMYQPGERWQYHVGSDVLGVLVSRAAGQSFETFLHERLVGPLGMVDTGFHVPADKRGRLPPSYAHDPLTGELTVWDKPDGKYSKPPTFQAGGDGLVSTADDYHRSLRMFLAKAEKVEKDLFSDHFGHHGGYGFGMAVRTHRRDLATPGQFGWDGGLGTTAYADPTENMVGILRTQTALDSADTPRLHKDFLRRC